MDAFGFGFLWLSTFFAGFSLPAGRLFMALSLVCVLVHLARERKRPEFPPVAWFGLAFLLLTCVVTVLGVNPELGVPKLRKLLWFIGLPLAANLVVTNARLTSLLGAYAGGTGVLAVRGAGA